MTIRTVTIWSTPASAIATRTEIIGWTDPEGAAAPEPIYSDPVLLERIARRDVVFERDWTAWARPSWSASRRADPASYGADNFKAGERILDVFDVKPSLGQYDRLGAMGEGVPDLDAGTMTYTWAKISADAFDPATHHAPVWSGVSWSAPAAKSLATRKAAMLEMCRQRFRAVRDQGTAIDFGTGAVAVQTTPEAANDVERLHGDLTLRAAGGEQDPTQDIATSQYIVVPGVTVAMAAAMREVVAVHWRATLACDAAVGAAIQAAANHAALDLIDVAAGTVTVEGVPTGGWPG